MGHQIWHYFLSVEKDFVRSIDFVELHADNSKTFSAEYAKLLLLIGSEVDVVAKMLCAKIAPDKKLPTSWSTRTSSLRASVAFTQWK